MAKRRRLGPASLIGNEALPDDLETKSARFNQPPIAGVARDVAENAALTEMSEALRSARAEGRMVLELPLRDIALDYLVRDRVELGAEELDTLVASLRARGQQTPIEVVETGAGSYGLISGWRRCKALEKLAEETGEEPVVQALLRKPKDAPDAYLAMVEENEIRVGLSFYERARIVVRAADLGVYDTDRAALKGLFGSVSRPKRSKIGSFMSIVRALDEVLRFPTAIPERLGLDLSKRLVEDPKLKDHIVATLTASPPSTPEAERAILEARPKAPQEPEPLPKREKIQISKGLWFRENADGTATVGGPGLTDEIKAELVAWLEDRC